MASTSWVRWRRMGDSSWRCCPATPFPTRFCKRVLLCRRICMRGCTFCLAGAGERRCGAGDVAGFDGPSPGVSPLGGTRERNQGRIWVCGPFPRFGYWLPGRGIVDEVALDKRAAVPLLFYRAALEGRERRRSGALCAELDRQGLRAVPLMISTLKGRPAYASAGRVCGATPEVIPQSHRFCAGRSAWARTKLSPFAGCDAPVIQLVQGRAGAGTMGRRSQGLTARTLPCSWCAARTRWPHRRADRRTQGRGGVARGDAMRAQCLCTGHGWRGARSATGGQLDAAAPDAAGERRVGIVLANYPRRSAGQWRGL